MKVELNDFEPELVKRFLRAKSIVENFGYKPAYHLSKLKGSTYQKFKMKGKPNIWVGFAFIQKANGGVLYYPTETDEEIINFLVD
jgi:hypothetical protein